MDDDPAAGLVDVEPNLQHRDAVAGRADGDGEISVALVGIAGHGVTQGVEHVLVGDAVLTGAVEDHRLHEYKLPCEAAPEDPATAVFMRRPRLQVLSLSACSNRG
jgi:hypothetical protein